MFGTYPRRTRIGRYHRRWLALCSYDMPHPFLPDDPNDPLLDELRGLYARTDFVPDVVLEAARAAIELRHFDGQAQFPGGGPVSGKAHRCEHAKRK